MDECCYFRKFSTISLSSNHSVIWFLPSLPTWSEIPTTREHSFEWEMNEKIVCPLSRRKPMVWTRMRVRPIYLLLLPKSFISFHRTWFSFGRHCMMKQMFRDLGQASFNAWDRENKHIWLSQNELAVWVAQRVIEKKTEYDFFHMHYYIFLPWSLSPPNGLDRK